MGVPMKHADAAAVDVADDRALGGDADDHGLASVPGIRDLMPPETNWS